MAGNDANTLALLHLNDDFSDVAIGGSHIWTPRGSAQIDTSQSKFGAGCALFNGSTDWIDTPTNADLAFATGNFTFDGWVKFASTAAQQGIMGAYVDANNFFQIWFFGNTALWNYKWLFYHKDGGVVRGFYYLTGSPADPGTADWHHWAWVRSGANAYFFLDGVSLALTESTAWGTISAINSVYQAGAAKSTAGTQTYFNGRKDEFRISNIARWTGNFTPETSEYSTGELVISAGPISLTVLPYGDILENVLITASPIPLTISALGSAHIGEPEQLAGWRAYKGEGPWSFSKQENKPSYNEGNRIATYSDPVWPWGYKWIEDVDKWS